MNLLPWGTSYLSPELDDWNADVYDLVEILFHADDFRPGGKRFNAPAECFTSSNFGWKTQDLLNKAGALGHGVVANVDIHVGNGRLKVPGDIESATGWGVYSSTWVEGGVLEAVRAILAHRIPNLVAIQICNEPKDGIAKWYGTVCAQVRAMLDRDSRGILLIGGSSEKMCEVAAPFAHALDPHVIYKTPSQRDAIMRKTLAHGLPVWVNESTEAPGVLLAMGADVESAFAGNRRPGSRFHKKYTEWNLKKDGSYVRHAPPFNCNWQGGFTPHGEAVTAFWGGGEVIEPPDPPDPPIEPPKPDPDVNLKKARELNVKARKSLEKGKKKVTSGHLKRQARALGMDP